MIETPEYADMLGRMIRAYAKRVGDGDPVDLARMVELEKQFHAAVQAAVDGQRDAGFSWREIGEQGLGTTKQSAQITYGRRRGERDTGAA